MTESIKTEERMMHRDVTVTTSAKPVQIHFAGDPAGVSFDMDYARKAVNCHAELVEIATKYIALIQSDYESRNGTFGSMQEQYDRAYAVLERCK